MGGINKIRAALSGKETTILKLEYLTWSLERGYAHERQKLEELKKVAANPKIIGFGSVLELTEEIKGWNDQRMLFIRELNNLINESIKGKI
jgi:hypothetical protein